MESLLAVDIAQWQQEMASVLDYLEGYGERLPAELLAAHETVVEELQKAV
jgi:GTP-dependent phosphoenolpyruvate carboxykinase